MEWKEMAQLLAGRLRHQAYNCSHSAKHPNPDCGYCEDGRVVDMFDRMNGGAPPDPFAGAKRVLVSDLKPEDTRLLSQYLEGDPT